MEAAFALLIDEAKDAIATCGMLDGTKGAKQKETRFKAATCVIAMWNHSGKLRALADKMSSFKDGAKFTASKSFAGAARRSDADLWLYLFVVVSGCGEFGGKPVSFLPGTCHHRVLFKDGKLDQRGSAKRTAEFTGFKLNTDSTEWVEPSTTDYAWADDVLHKYHSVLFFKYYSIQAEEDDEAAQSTAPEDDEEDDKEENRLVDDSDDDAEEEKVDATLGKRKLSDRFKELNELYDIGYLNECDYNKQKKKLMKFI